MDYNEPLDICKEIAPQTMQRLKEHYIELLPQNIQEKKNERMGQTL